MWNVWEEGGEIHEWFWWANLKEGYHLEDLGRDEKIILKLNLRRNIVGRSGLESSADRWMDYELIYQLNAIEYLLCTISSTCIGLTRPSSGA